MKTKTLLLTFFAVLFYFNTFAQDLLKPSKEKNYTEYMDKLLVNLKRDDAKLFKNGILYDRVYPKANLDVFNLTDSLNTSNYEHFFRAWSELYSASVETPDFYPTYKVSDFAYDKERHKKIQVGIINIDFSQIDSIALVKGKQSLKTVKGIFEKIPGKNPYLDNHVTVISTLNSDIISGKEVEFEFGKIFLNKSNRTIKDLTVEFENNQSFDIFINKKLINRTITVKFETPGIKKVSYKITYNNNSKTITHSTFALASPTSSSESWIIPITATIPFQGYDENEYCNGTCYGHGEYKIFYAPGHTGIIKPFITVDGFDPNDKRKIDGVSDYETVYQMMHYKDGYDVNGQNHLISTLNIMGYDVIILNFPKYPISSEEYTVIEHDPYTGDPYEVTQTYSVYRDGGTDYIERNAKTVEELLKIVKQEMVNNGSAHKIKIAGPSMAALIVQFALAEMEKNNQPHNVDLFISFDGPHKGANVSIGMQKGLEYFTTGTGIIENRVNSSATDAMYYLNNPAAKQMLIAHYLSNTEGVPSGAPGFRDRFQNSLNTLGFPKQCRNIAVLNGSIAGAEKAVAGSNMIEADISLILGGFLHRHLSVDYTFNSGQYDVFRFLKENWYGANTQADIRRKSTTLATYGSLDNSPGGFFPAKELAESQVGAQFPLYFAHTRLFGITNIPMKWYQNFSVNLIVEAVYANMYDNFCFVPAKSAIAYSGSNTLWRENMGCRNLTCTGETPFNNYYAPNTNQEHATLWVSGINWLIQELDNNPAYPQPSKYGDCTLANTNINGDNTICYNEIKSYSLSNSCNGSATWTASGNIQILSSAATQAIIKSNNTDADAMWVKASFPNGQSLIKNLIGKPNVYAQITANGSFPEVNIIGNTIELSTQGISSIVWQKTGGDGILHSVANQANAYATGSGTYWYVDGLANVSNTCGTTMVDFTLMPAQSDPCNTLTLKKVDKNTYQLVQPCETNPLALTVESAELYTTTGEKLTTLKTNGSYIDINNNFGSGIIRILKVVSKGKVISKQVLTD